MTSLDMNRRTGAWIQGWDRIRQSIFTIITTPRLSRVIRRAFGSKLRDLIDAPMSDQSILSAYVAIAMALEGVVENAFGEYVVIPSYGEPCFKLTQINFIKGAVDGHVVLALQGIEFPNGHKGDFTQASAIDRTVEFTLQQDSERLQLIA